MVESETMTGYAVIIDSIGEASPAVSKVLADGLGLPIEVIVKALYNTPSVMFSKIDENVAEDAVKMLNALGLNARMQPSDDPLPEDSDTMDVGVYIHDARYLPTVCTQLSEFLGCEQNEALSLLMAEPPLVLGGVSFNTAEALSKRINAEVVASSPKKELYTIEILKRDPLFIGQLQKYLDHHKIEVDLKDKSRIENLDYSTSNDLCRKFQSTGMVKILNQGFQRYEVVLDEVDTENPEYKTTLIEHVGMPPQIIDRVLKNLPIELDASLNAADLAVKLELYTAAGLKCTVNRIVPAKYKLIITKMKDLTRVRQILNQFMKEDQLPKTTARWESPEPFPALLARYAVELLEGAECEIDHEQIV